MAPAAPSTKTPITGLQIKCSCDGRQVLRNYDYRLEDALSRTQDLAQKLERLERDQKTAKEQRRNLEGDRAAIEEAKRRDERQLSNKPGSSSSLLPWRRRSTAVTATASALPSPPPPTSSPVPSSPSAANTPSTNREAELLIAINKHNQLLNRVAQKYEETVEYSHRLEAEERLLMCEFTQAQQITHLLQKHRRYEAHIYEEHKRLFEKWTHAHQELADGCATSSRNLERAIDDLRVSTDETLGQIRGDEHDRRLRQAERQRMKQRDAELQQRNADLQTIEARELHDLQLRQAARRVQQQAAEAQAQTARTARPQQARQSSQPTPSSQPRQSPVPTRSPHPRPSPQPPQSPQSSEPPEPPRTPKTPNTPQSLLSQQSASQLLQSVSSQTPVSDPTRDPAVDFSHIMAPAGEQP